MQYYEFQCLNCGKIIKREQKCLKQKIKRNQPNHFCSHQCMNKYHITTISRPCGWCGNLVHRSPSQLKKSKSGLVFCNHACSISYNNTQKRNNARSKCEILLCDLIQIEFPKLTIINNDKKTLNGYEIDIFIPSLKLAIEWNGIVHFKPIYGNQKLNKIQERDKQKQILAQKIGINFIVIPDLVSTEKYVRESFFKIKQIIYNLQVAASGDTKS